MWHRLGHIAGRALLLSLPGLIVTAGLFLLGYLDAVAVAVAAALCLLLGGLIAIPFAVSVASAGAAIEALGPDAAASDKRAFPTRRLSPAARALWPAVLRLRRAWRDHAERVQARLAAAEAVVDATPEPLIVIDRRRRILRANAAAGEFAGPVAQGQDLAAALRNPALLAATDAVLRGEAGRVVEFASPAPPTDRVLRAHLARIPHSALDGAAAILALHDVTGLKRAEQMRADFIANAGHELKTPLATLIGFIETLQGPARDDAAARERFLAIMQEQASRMARLVEDLLSLSRIELNEHVPPIGRVALAPLIDEVARGLQLRAAERRVRIACALPADLPEVQGERDELAQVFQNLLDNAIKYGRPETEIAVTASRGGTTAVPLVGLSVADRGEGIAAEHLPRLTERFYRVDTARSRELGGTGLGLAIVKHIVNRHRGRLGIASTLGKGSTFTVWLRAAGPPRTAPIGGKFLSPNGNKTVT